MQNGPRGGGRCYSAFCILHSAFFLQKGLLPVLPRPDFLTKEACGLPQGGEVVAIPSAALGTAGL